MTFDDCDDEEVEQVHNDLATKHGRDNVFVAKGDRGRVVAVISDGIGAETFEDDRDVQLESYEYVRGEVPDHGHRIYKEHRGVNLREFLNLVPGYGDDEDGQLVFSGVDKMLAGFDPDWRYECTECNFIAHSREEARAHMEDPDPV